MNNDKIKKGYDFSLNKIDTYLGDFFDSFPEAAGKGYVYGHTECVGWTPAFYTGMLWLCYELTKDEKYLKVCESHFKLFKYRIDNKIRVVTHDLGFLYTLSCVAGYKLTGDAEYKKTAIKAAEELITRYNTKGKFIQAWGEFNDPESNRLIIDCLLNLPLLFWASEATGDEKYAVIAKNHLKTALSVVVRDDGTTHHTYYFDYDTGAPLKGVTHQGYSDTSCWARGQAWGIYGAALAYAYTKDKSIIDIYNKVMDCFISRQPADGIPFWDMDFTDGDNEPRDSSAAAIAICGILEMDKYVKNEKYLECADKMMTSLVDNYLTDEKSNGLLTEGMYNKNKSPEPECNIWGDYYFLEAVMRYKNPDWNMYW